MTFVPSAYRTPRRGHLAPRWLGTVAVLLACAAGPAAAFDFEELTRLARERAAQPFKAADAALPAELAQLDYDGLRDIRWRPERALWRDQELPYEAMFFHRGALQPQPVLVNEVAPDGSVRHIGYDRSAFDFGANRLQPQRWGDLGFAGLRLHYPLNSVRYKDELAVFQGASYFRALGQGQQYGLSARGLAIDTVGAKGEEFPRFTEFWLVRPAAHAPQVTVYALLESPRATGAYRFDIEPDAQTVTRVHSRLFLRDGGAPVATLGVAPLTSMFFFGENQPRQGDFRPEVHDSDGLMVAAANGEWLWRPLSNPRSPSVTSFALTDPQGFGLMQRDRQWASYEDVEARYERRPSAWVRPLGKWGPGRVELVQLPTPDETHDNIVAYWVPREAPRPGQALEFNYEILWQGDQQQRPPGSWVTQTRRGMGYTRQSAEQLRGQVQYVLDFAGPALQALPPDTPLKAVVSSDANGRVLEQLAYPNPATGGWRVTLRVQRLNPGQPVELRAFLQHNNDAVSETWTHLLLPE
ncbi:glucan biosynthesis protein G [Pulveribacter suum]|uniref:Glucans biosynthesis protein G n=1 Tax=Pulveribacter suum TaxID=2116657 RepID=A0A2P1NIU1_9BURK|nr:glucan biosynthesis protein G [Pulveribacter suum]AVP56975.1 glucan biosynthesis protein D [Pulveribacter suum]